MRDDAVRTASEQPYDAIRDVILRVSLKGDVAEATHTISEVTPMDDHWIRTPTGWKLQARARTGDPKEYIDKLPPEMDNPKAPSVKSS